MPGFSELLTFLTENPMLIAWFFGGLVLIALLYAIGRIMWQRWVGRVQAQFTATHQYTLLAIDIPRLNEQSMKAVEHILATLHGVHKDPSSKEKYWHGVVEDVFSLELISIDGYIQYFVRCESTYTELVKSAFFAQYPDAEIVEVQDYTQLVSDAVPNPTHDWWGTEFVLAKPDIYPIKTYEHFEHNLTGSFADPIAAVLEVLSRLHPGEQVWLQLLISPAANSWREAGVAEVHSLIGKGAPKPSPFAFLGKFFGSFAREVAKQVRGPVEAAEVSAGDFSNLTTGDRVVVEEIQKNITRMAFLTKFRVLYVAPVGQLHTGRVMSAVVGAIKQFNTLDVNAFVGGTNTSASGWFGKAKKEQQAKQAFLQACKARAMGVGDPPYNMSTVELATIYHFPVETVRAPLLTRTATKKSEPPTSLPFDTPFSPLAALRNPGSVLDSSAEVVTSTMPTGPRPLVIPKPATLLSPDRPALPAGMVIPPAASYQTPPAAAAPPATSGQPAPSPVAPARPTNDLPPSAPGSSQAGKTTSIPPNLPVG